MYNQYDFWLYDKVLEVMSLIGEGEIDGVNLGITAKWVSQHGEYFNSDDGGYKITIYRSRKVMKMLLDYGAVRRIGNVYYKWRRMI